MRYVTGGGCLGRVSAERVLVNVPAPMLRCSAPVLVLVHMCFYIHAVGSVLLDGARVPQPYAPTFRCSTPLHSCQLLKSCTPMLRSSLESAPLHSAAALPLRCSDAPLRSAAQPSAPMLRSAPLRKPLLRCSTPSSAAALPLRCSDAPCTSLRCATLRSDAPMLRCAILCGSDPPRRSAAQPSAPMLRCSTPLRSSCVDILRSDAPMLGRNCSAYLFYAAAQQRTGASATYNNSAAPQQRSSAPSQLQPNNSAAAQQRSSALAQVKPNNSAAAQQRTGARKQQRSSAAQPNNSAAAQ